jgi:hypothetical protein
MSIIYATVLRYEGYQARVEWHLSHKDLLAWIKKSDRFEKLLSIDRRVYDSPLNYRTFQ